jgi:predicted anti-sigma-YlaC factor YlaD
MECDTAREALSARIDGEDPGVPGGALETHLARCEACRGWQQRAHVMTRRARLGGPFLDHDLAGLVLGAVPPAPARRRLRLALRAALLAAALGQLAVTMPLLILGHDQDAGAHAAHELGSFDLALAIAFAVGAIRPALSAGLAWTCGIAAAGLACTAIADLIGGQTIGADEAQHLIAVAGAVLLIWQARTADTEITVTGAAGATDWLEAAPSSRAPGLAIVSRLEGTPRSPGDGAARVTAPDTARAAPAGGLPDGAQVGAQSPNGTPLPRPRPERERERDGDGRQAVA